MQTGVDCKELNGILRIYLRFARALALMRDQVESLRQAGIRAAALNSSLTDDEHSTVRADMAAGRLAGTAGVCCGVPG